MAKTGGTIALKNVGQSDCETVRLSIFSRLSDCVTFKNVRIVIMSDSQYSQTVTV